MIAFARFMLLFALVLGLVHAVIWLRLMRRARARLGADFDRRRQEGDRRAYLEKGLQRYRRRLRWRLAATIWLLPLMLVSGLVYLINFR